MRSKAAAARVTDRTVVQFQAICTPAMVLDRFRAYDRAAVATLGIRLDEANAHARIAPLEQTMDLVRQI